jgi:hypothetical protein
MDTKEIIKNEQGFLRLEIQELKKCQLQYFISSVAGTGIIFGLIDKPTDGKELFFLAPLIILIPCWWTFFDKATTITRLVGYTMCLENQLASENPKYIGYETALKTFRQQEDEAKNSSAKKTRFSIRDAWRKLYLSYKHIHIKELFKLVFLRTRHRYWMINWYTFFALTVICCLLPFRFGLKIRPFNWEKLPWYLAFLALALSIIFTSKIVFSLTHGKYSYERVFEFWKENVFQDVWYDQSIKKSQP